MIKRAIVLLVVAAALAAGGAGWKWQHSGNNSKGNYRIAGWTWGDDAARWSGDET